jgi:hypothetical protein
MDKREIVAPVVNLNGSSKASLLEAFWNAHSALVAAQGAFASIAPHGRDFQTAPQGTFERARLQWALRATELTNLTNDVQRMIVEIDGQGRVVTCVACGQRTNSPCQSPPSGWARCPVG